MPRLEKAFVDIFYGQDEAVRAIKQFCDGAVLRRVPCPSLLLIGRYGVGKSTLAPAIAEYYRTKCHKLPAGKDLSPHDLREALLEMESFEFLFIDEAHSLTRPCQELLHLALDKHLTFDVKAKGKLDRSKTQSIVPFTLLLATNEPGNVRPALRSRLTFIEFRPYRISSLILIAQSKAPALGLTLTGQAARVLAEAAQGCPRNVCNNLQLLQLQYPEAGRIEKEDVKAFIATLGINEDGLLPIQREYLLTVYAIPHKGAALERLSARLGVDKKMVYEEYEPFLIERGLIEISGGRGRTLTSEGAKLAKKYAEEDEATEQAAVEELKLEEEE